MQLQIESQISYFHRSQRRNLASMVVGMAYARSCRILWTRTAAGLNSEIVSVYCSCLKLQPQNMAVQFALKNFGEGIARTFS